jgi:predicted DNA-binding transcriptional regulator AlpA
MSSRSFPRRPVELDHLLTLREAMERYGISRWTLYSQAAAGKLRAVRRGDEGRVYYLESEIQALINRSCEPLAA